MFSSRWWGWFHNTILEEDHVGLSCYGSYAYVRAYAVQPLIFPVMWARDAAASFLRTPDEMRALIEAVGFRAHTWDVTGVVPGLAPGAPVSAHNIYHLVMGDAMAAITHAGNRNNEEGRMVTVQAVFDRP